MKSFTTLTAAADTLLAGSSGLAAAFDDFWIFHKDASVSHGGGNVFNFVRQIDCHELWEAGEFPPRDDVSGGKFGVRFVGSESDPQVIEMNTVGVDLGHYTWYKDRGNALVDLNDNVLGHCDVVPIDLSCDGDDKWVGHSILFCHS
ncbi:uncharacterized protein JN550_005161 [Neoarthrinium moseri]|uniref:uncharacterized protein n=1 Tax=Neoarthrinium moseri TaxID=1658444 RepID=UPI001FDB2FE8|nr:uncharacterized protein JN550_005161 [Neoarthrinium moseri]KAI1870618.1 hypothetical protein JN550_005161 [Neoarthrinium moseri]